MIAYGEFTNNCLEFTRKYVRMVSGNFILETENALVWASVFKYRPSCLSLGGQHNDRTRLYYPESVSRSIHESANVSSKRGRIMATSKMQRAFSQALSFHFGGYTIRENSRPSWCLGDNFERLELDFLIQELNIAIEIQGEQHYKFSPGFHATYADFEAQQARDSAKKERCDEYGITLLEVYDDPTFSDAIEHISKAVKGTVRGMNSQDVLEWEHRLRQISETLKNLLRHQGEIDQGRFLNTYEGTKNTLRKCLKEYGAFGVDFINPQLAESIFISLQHISGRARKLYKTANVKRREQRLKRFAKLRWYRLLDELEIDRWQNEGGAS